MQDYQLTFIDLALSRQALRFGRFTLKSGRESPYFFNAGLFSDGEAIAVLGRCYAAAIVRSAPAFDVLFGPAYKGIPLARPLRPPCSSTTGATCRMLSTARRPRTTARAAMSSARSSAGRVLVIDDVVTAGTAVRESLTLIRQQGAQPAGVIFALDRQERGQGALSATQEIESEHGIPCVSVVTLADLIEALSRPTGRAGCDF